MGKKSSVDLKYYLHTQYYFMWAPTYFDYTGILFQWNKNTVRRLDSFGFQQEKKREQTKTKKNTVVGIYLCT